MTLKNVQQLGIAEARIYEKKLISHFNLLIQQGNPSADINKDLSTQVDAVDKEVERDTKSIQRQQGFKARGKGKNGGLIPTNKIKAKGKGRYPKPEDGRKLSWDDQQPPRNRNQDYHKAKGKGSKSKDHPQNHICFHHDPRKGNKCQKTGCMNQHLDTTIESEAKRYDDAKAIADANYQKKWGTSRG